MLSNIIDSNYVYRVKTHESINNKLTKLKKKEMKAFL